MSDQEVQEAAGGLRLFTGEPQYENFSRMQHTLNVNPMAASSKPFAFPNGAPIDLPKTYRHDGAERDLMKLIEDTHTSALFILKDGEVRFERYWLTGGRDVQWLSASVAKSFISALVGIALAEGKIASLDDAITRYATELAGTAYDGVRIRDVLQMSSGALWDEDYTKPETVINQLIAALEPGGSYDDFMSTMVRESEPGTVCQYDSADTQALGMMLKAATGRPIADYMREKLTEPLGMESTGYWIADSRDMEMAFGGLLLTARDFAKLGELYRNGGEWQGRRIVPADYVAQSVKADAPHLAPGKPIVGGHAFPLGYGYQWWLPDGPDGEFSAIGVYNQYVYVDPSRGIVITKLSANPTYGLSHDDSDNKDIENISAFRAICRQFD